jgi:hypothetical protein
MGERRTASTVATRFAESVQFFLVGVMPDLCQDEMHQLLGQVAVEVNAGCCGPDVRSWPRESVEFGRYDPRPIGVEPEALFRRGQNLNTVFLRKRRCMRDGQDLHHRVALLGLTRQDDTARPVLDPVFAPHSRRVPP